MAATTSSPRDQQTTAKQFTKTCCSLTRSALQAGNGFADVWSGLRWSSYIDALVWCFSIQVHCGQCASITNVVREKLFFMHTTQSSMRRNQLPTGSYLPETGFLFTVKYGSQRSRRPTCEKHAILLLYLLHRIFIKLASIKSKRLNLPHN